MSEKLRNCPFCGSEKVAVAGWSDCCEVLCENCTSASRVENSEEKAIAAWNRRASGWISVEDRLPELARKVLVTWKSGNDYCVDTAFRIDEGWSLTHWELSSTAKVTHWMPLPEPPKEDEK